MLTKSDLSAIGNLIKPLEARLSGVENGLKRTEKKVTDVETKVISLENKVTGVENRVVSVESKVTKLATTVKNNRKASQREHAKLQKSIIIIVDTVGEDVFVLKNKMEKVQQYVGLAAV